MMDVLKIVQLKERRNIVELMTIHLRSVLRLCHFHKVKVKENITFQAIVRRKM